MTLSSIFSLDHWSFYSGLVRTETMCIKFLTQCLAHNGSWRNNRSMWEVVSVTRLLIYTSIDLMCAFDIWNQIILCCRGCCVYYRMFRSILDLHPQLYQYNMSPDIVKCTKGHQITIIEKHWCTLYHLILTKILRGGWLVHSTKKLHYLSRIPVIKGGDQGQ